MGGVTLVEVARHANVSLATASRVLNGSQRIPTEAIAERVRASARELGYVANAQAQALARSVTGLVGLVVHDITDPYFSTITRGAQHYAGAQRSQILLASAERNQRAELQAVATFVAYRTQAIILAGSRRVKPDDELAAELARYLRNGGRVVTLGPSTIPDARFLKIRHRAGAQRLVEALIGRGVTDFTILAGPPELRTAHDRVQGYQQALVSAGIDPLAVLPSDFDREGGFATAQRFWTELPARQRSRRVCLLAVNDVMALGAISGLRALGVAVPQDVQVAGFDDIPTLRDFTPSLTTVRLPLETIGEKAAELALALQPDELQAIDGEPVLRDSAG
ncbi:MAG: LacI family DNA-binding transcriptional regulator [Friedmanniella sp.]